MDTIKQRKKRNIERVGNQKITEDDAKKLKPNQIDERKAHVRIR